MPEKTIGTERVGVILSADLLADCDRVRADLRRQGRRVSFSGLVDTALRELLSRRDLGAILERHGAKARRS